MKSLLFGKEKKTREATFRSEDKRRKEKEKEKGTCLLFFEERKNKEKRSSVFFFFFGPGMKTLQPIENERKSNQPIND
jgi:hypothetical protein